MFFAGSSGIQELDPEGQDGGCECIGSFTSQGDPQC